MLPGLSAICTLKYWAVRIRSAIIPSSTRPNSGYHPTGNASREKMCDGIIITGTTSAALRNDGMEVDVV